MRAIMGAKDRFEIERALGSFHRGDSFVCVRSRYLNTGRARFVTPAAKSFAIRLHSFAERRVIPSESMRKWLVFLLAGGALQAAIIKGSVVENQTGKALARTLISIQPLPGSAGPTGSVRTNTYGMFEFIDLPAGAYLIHASRRGFMTVQYGQKNWRAAGQPIVLDEDQSTFLSIRMPRFSSISGVIVDENDVGLPEHEVVAMSNTRPPRMMAKAQADDRGMYRISGLDPGAYLVRTLGRAYEEGGYLPTFYRETARVDEAGMVETLLDQETTNIKVRPFPGKLFTISGTVSNSMNTPVMVTLVSDVGRETITTGRDVPVLRQGAGPLRNLRRGAARPARGRWALTSRWRWNTI